MENDTLKYERCAEMGHIQVKECEIAGIKVITPEVFKDSRGYFQETYQQKSYEEAGITCCFVQDNQSYSTKGVLRGLHFQKQFPQAKLIRVIQGEIFDAAVDLRKESATYGKWFGIHLSAENRQQLFIPEGFAHGYVVLSEEALILYKCSETYHPRDEGGILWNDRELGVQWPVKEEDVILSEKDCKWPGWNTYKMEAGTEK